MKKYLYPLFILLINLNLEALCNHHNKINIDEIYEDILIGSVDHFEKLQEYLIIEVFPDIISAKNLSVEEKEKSWLIIYGSLLQKEKIKNAYIILYGIFNVLKKLSQNEPNCLFLQQLNFRNIFKNLILYIEQHSYEETINNYNETLKLHYGILQKIISDLKYFDFSDIIIHDISQYFVTGILEGIHKVEKIKEKFFTYSLEIDKNALVYSFMTQGEKHINFLESIISEWIEYCTTMLHSREYRSERKFFNK